ncbi:hypothetical protein SNEBB_010965 [Seison nebaliae]|nr:hypothetical protein SNEBB_010965 [Seison nebaliae]
MARMGMDVRTQNAWNELINKESVTRVQWHLTKKGKQEEKLPNLNNELEIKKYLDDRSKLYRTSSLNDVKYPPKPKSKAFVPPSSEQLKILKETKDMLDVNCEQKQLLYEGLSQEQKGRYQYLHNRSRNKPEERYNFPVLSSMEYGWKINENAEQSKGPHYARSKIIEDSFYRRNGMSFL